MIKPGLIIMLCRNTLRYSRECLKSLLKQSVPVEILVIDNASTDGTAKHMASQQALHSNIYRMNYMHVASVATAWNDGLNWGWQRGHEQALVVNSDTELLPDTYRRLRDFLFDAAPEIGMVTAVGVDKDPSYPGEQLNPRPHPDYSCFMIRQRTHKYIPFDGHFEGAYFEDADHHVRMSRAGIWAGSIDLGFLHHSSGTLKHATREEQDRINFNYNMNKIRFFNQYGCLPGSAAYERLFLPANGDSRAQHAEEREQPQAE